MALVPTEAKLTPSRLKSHQLVPGNHPGVLQLDFSHFGHHPKSQWKLRVMASLCLDAGGQYGSWWTSACCGRLANCREPVRILSGNGSKKMFMTISLFVLQLCNFSSLLLKLSVSWLYHSLYFFFFPKDKGIYSFSPPHILVFPVLPFSSTN